jgi:hypothetical protein
MPCRRTAEIAWISFADVAELLEDDGRPILGYAL